MLELGSDVGIRRQWFTAESFAHPAKLHLSLLQWIIDRYTLPGDTIGDPMAGIGSILLAATQQRNVIAREIEPQWLEQLHRNASRIYAQAGLLAGRIEIGQADAREPWTFTADHIVFSPPYGCDFTNVSGNSRRGYLSAKQAKLAKLEGGFHRRWEQLFVQPEASGAVAGQIFRYGNHPAQIGHFRDRRYWDAMRAIYTNAHASLRRHGVMVLIIKDHIRNGRRVTVADDTVSLCENLGFCLDERHARHVWPLSLWQRRRKERGEPIVEEEDVLVFRKAVL